MIAMAGDLEQLKEMGTRAQRRLDRYSVPVAVEGLVQCLNSVLSLKKLNAVPN